jgi:DNA-binding helix-hairpin-helix protein with protein kinase domain
MNPALRRTSLSTWNRLSVAKAVREICVHMNFLHNNGIIIGDISPRNILVNQSGQIFFIDCDSFQIDSEKSFYPCEVGTPDTLAPEISKSGKNLSEFKRTELQERFSIAVLIFQMFMDGRNPFDHVNGGSPSENIISGKFPYGSRYKLDANGNPTENRTSRPFAKIPRGDWYKRWKSFPFKVKSGFIKTFVQGHQDPKNRTSASDWIALMDEYIYLLKKGWVPGEWEFDEKWVKRTYSGGRSKGKGNTIFNGG